MKSLIFLFALTPMVSHAFLGQECLKDAEFWSRYTFVNEIKNEAHGVAVNYNNDEKQPIWGYVLSFDDGVTVGVKCRPKQRGDTQYGCYCYGFQKNHEK